MKAADVAARIVPPLRTIVLTPKDFATECAPKGEVAMGLRLISDADESSAREEAAKKGREHFERTKDEDSSTAEFNDELMARLVGASLCDVNDAKSHPEDLPFPTEGLRERLTSSGIRKVWLEIEKLRAETSTCFREANDDELEYLTELIDSDAIQRLSSEAAQAKARRYAAFLLDVILHE